VKHRRRRKHDDEKTTSTQVSLTASTTKPKGIQATSKSEENAKSAKFLTRQVMLRNITTR